MRAAPNSRAASTTRPVTRSSASPSALVGLGVGDVAIVLLALEVDVDVVALERPQKRVVSLQPMQQRWCGNGCWRLREGLRAGDRGSAAPQFRSWR